MSQATPNGGNCPNCNQFQPYTNQMCDFCGVSLPWRVQRAVAPVTAPPVVQPSVGPPPVPGSMPFRVEPQKKGIPVWGWLLIALLGVPFCVAIFTIGVLSIAGNNMKNSAASNSPTMSVSGNSAPGPVAPPLNSAAPTDCGLMSTEECSWANSAAQILNGFGALQDIPGESEAERMARAKPVAIQAQTDAAKLPAPPPRFVKVKASLDGFINNFVSYVDAKQTALNNNDNSPETAQKINGFHDSAISYANQTDAEFKRLHDEAN